MPGKPLRINNRKARTGLFPDYHIVPGLKRRFWFFCL